MGIEIKFCGLTRPDDARQAAALGAGFAGVIFAPGPRRLQPERAADVLDAAGPAVRRVGVFGTVEAREVARVARMARLDIAQLHGDPSAENVREVRGLADVAVWAVLRVGGEMDVAARCRELAQAADAIVLDAYVPGELGGTGVAFDWSAVARVVPRPGVRLVLAGGLNPTNIAAAIAALHPDVVDVSSGVERERGIKDHDRMRAFAAAVRQAESGL